MLAQIWDGFTNVVAQLGTWRDKASASTYALTMMNRQELLAAYRTAWLPQAIVDIPADDAVRKWRAWQAEPQQITALEADEKRLNVREQVRDALKAARLFGGACVYIDVGDRNPALPLRADRVGQGGLRSLTVLTPNQITPDAINRDILSGFYGRPEFYNITGERGQVRVHASRLAVFHGAPQVDVSLATDGWGDSVLMACMDAVKHADGASANIASMTFEAKVSVFKFKGMAQQLANGGEEADKLLAKRLQSQALLKGMNGDVVIDGDDDFQQRTIGFGGLDAIWDRFALNVAGAARIPVTRLFGRSAAGLSGSGDGDERTYFDRIAAMQSLEMEPAMTVLDECLIRSALGSRPDDVWYSWNPLRQVTEQERATLFKTYADGARAIIGSGGTSPALMVPEVIGGGLLNRIVEDGLLPGVEALDNEFGGLAEQEDDTDAEAALDVPAVEVPEQVVSDAAPRTLYVSRKVLNAAEIMAWAKGQGFATTLAADDLHVTIAYSRTPLDWMKVGQAWDSKLELPEGGPRLMEQFGEARVLLFKASDLEWRHGAIKEAGASWDHPEYQPHITISYGPDAPDLASVQPYQGRIVLGPEIFAEVNEDWAKGRKEE